MTDNSDKGQPALLSTHAIASEEKNRAPKLTFLRKENGETRLEATGAFAIAAGVLLIIVPIIVIVVNMSLK